MSTKDPTKKPRRRRRTRQRPVERGGAQTAARCQIELQPVGAPSSFEEPASLLEAGLGEPELQRDLVRRVLRQLDLPVQSLEADAVDTRVYDDISVRIIADGTRLAVSFSLPRGDGEDLPTVLDAIFDLCFTLAKELELEVYDPQIDQLMVPSQYERKFQFILDHYKRRQQIADALADIEAWEHAPEAADLDALLDAQVAAPALQVPRDILPSRRRALRGRFGPIEMLGESAHRALEAAIDDEFLIALVDADDPVRPGEQAQLARIERYTRVARGVWLVELQALGLRDIERKKGTAVSLSAAHRTK